MTNNNRESIARKISALLAKTLANGATEAEALGAAEKAAELMAQYDVDVGELGFWSFACVKVTEFLKHYGRTVIGQHFGPLIAGLCDCKVWKSGLEVTFFGFQSDAEIAGYLFASLSNAVLTEIEAYKRSPEYAEAKLHGFNGKTLVTSFIAGMESRLGTRIRAMAIAKRGDVTKATGTDLVIVKAAKVEEELELLSLHFTKPKKVQCRVRSYTGYHAGVAAGERVAINPAIHA